MLHPMKRAILAAVATLAWTGVAGGQVKTGDPAKRGLSQSDFPRAKQLAPGVYSYEALRGGDPGGFMTTVSLIVITTDGVLVADGQGNVEATRAMVDWIAKTTTQPIKYVIVGSDHGDHTVGNAAFPENATFISHPTSKKVLETAKSARIPTETVDDRRTITLVHESGFQTTVELPDFVSQGEEVGDVARIVIAAWERQEALKGVGG